MDQVKIEFPETQKHILLEKVLKKKVLRAPSKKKVLTPNHSSYISKRLRNTIMRRSYFEKKRFEKRTDQSLRDYKKQKNYRSRLYKKEREKISQWAKSMFYYG